MRLRCLAGGVCLAIGLSMSYAIPAEAATLPSLTKMRTVLLRDADLPATFDRDRTSSDSTTASSTDPRCTSKVSDGALLSPLRDAPRVVHRSFQASRTGPFVTSAAAAWRGKAGADALLQHLRRVLRTCDSWTETDDDGIRYRIRLSRLDFPRLGADRVALRYTVIARGVIDVRGHSDIVVVRVRNGVTAVGEARIGSAVPVDQEALTRLSVNRLSAIL